MNNILQTILIIILIVSCKNSEEKEEGFGAKSISVLKSGINKADSLIIEKPYQYFKDRNIKADSLEKSKIENHFKNLKNTYPEYETIAKWFDSNPPQLNGVEGNYYKMLKGVIQDGKSITRKDMIEKSVNDTYSYFFESKEMFFILELAIKKEVVKCINVRRIMNGFGDEHMHDLVFNKKGELINEKFQCDVNPSLYEEDEVLFFEFTKEVKDKEIINTINLGKYLDI